MDLTTYAETEEQESDTIFIFQFEALWLGPPYKDSLTGHFNHSSIQSLYFFSIFWCSVFLNILSLHVLGYFGHSTFRISVGYSTFQNIPLFCHSVVAWTTCDFYCKTGFEFEEMFFCSSGSHNDCNVMPWYVRRKKNWKGRIHISTTCTVGFTALLLFQLLARARLGFTLMPLLHL